MQSTCQQGIGPRILVLACSGSIWGINQTTKRNMIMESIGNMFLGKLYISCSVSFLTLFPLSLVLRDDMNNLIRCASKSCEHMFGNMRQSDRDFNCSDFSVT